MEHSPLCSKSEVCATKLVVTSISVDVEESVDELEEEEPEIEMEQRAWKIRESVTVSSAGCSASEKNLTPGQYAVTISSHADNLFVLKP